MVRPTYEFSQGKLCFLVLPTLSFLSRWLFCCEKFLVSANSITDLARWQYNLKNFQSIGETLPITS
jgi:hypothetical protein